MLQVVALAWLQQQGVVPLLPAHWGSGQGNSSAPWALSLGLHHYKLDPPPALKAPPATAAAAAAVAEAVPAAAPEGEGENAEAPAAAADAEGPEAAAEKERGEGGDAAVAATAEAAAEVLAQQGGKGGPKGGAWEGLAGLLGPEDVAALAVYVGRLASSAAA